jgi:BirA family biotin operon repressor/biotin-[acetyl-CoA-carboxylase] ligase
LTDLPIPVNLIFIMVNKTGAGHPALSTRARLLAELRARQGEPLNGSVLAGMMGVSRTAIWKNIQTLNQAGYPIETTDAGYFLNPRKTDDFLYPWEFGANEGLFSHFDNTDSTMNRAREFALQGLPAGTVVIAEKQSAGRGRNGRVWASRQGGLFFTILYRPDLALADYTQSSMVIQIAVARVLTAVCGKPARLRWPNDVYIGRRKIAGVLTEVSGEGDRVKWLAGGVGINVNNPSPSGKTTSCAELVGKPVSRREMVRKTLDEIGRIQARCSPGAAYAQGNRLLAAEWNALADCMGAKAAVVDPGFGDYRIAISRKGANSRLLAKGVFAGVDPAGRCIIKSESGAGALYFNPGPASMIFLQEK